MRSRYEAMLEELRFKKEKLASEYINKLYFILSEEENLTPEECRAKIESDCTDIWSEDTIRKYLPPEAKNKTKRKAGRISAEVKKNRARDKKIREETKSIVVNAGSNSGSSSQLSTLVGGTDNKNSSDNNDDDNSNSVGINPTENSPIRPKKLESSPFQEVIDGVDEDYFSSLLGDRHKDEALQEQENSFLLGNEHVGNNSLLLPSKLVEQIVNEVDVSGRSGVFPDFELEHNGLQIISIRISTESEEIQPK